MSRIISFRGLLEDGGIDTVPLQTNNGLIGYRITKFMTIPNSPGTTGIESIIKIYKVPQTTPSVTVDFSDQRLLGVSYYQDDANVAYPSSQDIIFDSEIFNQDIYITLKQGTGTHSMNYYIELEQMKLDLSEQTVATLKNIRNSNVST